MIVAAKRAGGALVDREGRQFSLSPSHNEPVNGTCGPYTLTRHDGSPSQPMNGPYELVEQSGNVVVFNPLGLEVVMFYFFPSPNNGGFGVLDTEPFKTALVNA